jgi:hypothetical protein
LRYSLALDLPHLYDRSVGWLFRLASAAGLFGPAYRRGELDHYGFTTVGEKRRRSEVGT